MKNKYFKHKIIEQNGNKVKYLLRVYGRDNICVMKFLNFEKQPKIKFINSDEGLVEIEVTNEK